MRTNYVLIDFENVQPESLEQLTNDHFKVIVFVGASQVKLPFEVAASLQELGSRAEYVKISGNGSNALDFHIAYYIGRLAAEEPSAHFHIISKDAGFDPLIQHLRSKQILSSRVQTVADIPVVKALSPTAPSNQLLSSRVKTVADIPVVKALNPKAPSKQILSSRVKTVADIPVVKALNAKSPQERIAFILARLERNKASKPRTLKTLSSTIASFFQKQLSEKEVASLVQSLANRGYLKIAAGKVAYTMPSGC